MPYRRRPTRRTMSKSKKMRASSKRSVRFASSKKAVTEIVKSVVARAEETKYRSEMIEYRIGHNSQVVGTDFYPALPKLVQDQGGGAIYERLGRKITPRKIYLDLDISLTNVERSMALVVHVWVLTLKNAKDLGLLTTFIANRSGQLLLTGDANLYQGFNGQSWEAQLPINTNQFTVMKKVSFLLGKNTGVIQDSTTAGNQPLAQSVRRSLRIPLRCPKELLYEQDTNSPRLEYYPKNFAPFYAIAYHHQDQSSPDVLNTDLTVTSRAHIWFDDA